jgi:hypothetical protein
VSIKIAGGISFPSFSTVMHISVAFSTFLMMSWSFLRLAVTSVAAGIPGKFGDDECGKRMWETQSHSHRLSIM